MEGSVEEVIEYAKYKDFGKAYFCQYFDDAYDQKLTGTNRKYEYSILINVSSFKVK